MAILVAFPFGFSSIAFGLESSLEQGLCACNCLPALVGQNRSSDWVLPIPTALQSSNIYHTPCLSPLENDISQCNFAPLIPHPQLPSLPPWVLTFPRMGSPFFFFFLPILCIYEKLHKSGIANGIRSRSRVPFTSRFLIVFSLWVVSRPKLPHLQLPFPLYEARHQEQRCSKNPRMTCSLLLFIIP